MKDLITQARAVEARLRSKKVWLGDKQMDQIADTISSLCTALEAAQKDAERYRAIRTNGYVDMNRHSIRQQDELLDLFDFHIDHNISTIKALGGTK